MQACSYNGERARLEESFRGLTGKSKVTQGHLDPNVAKGISDERGPNNERRANRIWKTGREQAASQRLLETVLLPTSCFCLLFQRGSLFSEVSGISVLNLCDNFRGNFYIVLRSAYVVM